MSSCATAPPRLAGPHCLKGSLIQVNYRPPLATQRQAPACPSPFSYWFSMVSPTAGLLPYAQATATQRAQALHYLQARLRLHFPTLPARVFLRTLAEFRPALLLTGTQVALPHPELTQLVQYLGHAPELPLLNPPLYGRPALELAQYVLHTSELAVGALTELACAPAARCGPHLGALLRRLARPYPLAEQVVQAQRWDLPGSPRLPPGIPGGGPAPGSPVVERLLQQLVPLANPAVTLPAITAPPPG